MNATLTINQECNGLELYFPQKPDADILGRLKSAGWRYHRLKQCWYARQTEENRKLAESLAGDAGASASEPPASFFPAYDAVDGADIFRSADVSCWENDGGYFADVNAYISVRVNRIVIIDLRNALIPGRECERLVLEHEDLYDNRCLHSGLDTFRAVYDRYFIQRQFPDCQVYESMLRSMRTFTPFKPIKPIKAPEKWTITHVWKAILSGQIFQGTCDGRYTDDYAYDAAVNFRSGVSLHLAHPRKVKAGEQLGQDDIGGSSATIRLADSAIVVERPNLRIIKNREGGLCRLIECCYCPDSRRIYQADKGDLNRFSWNKEGIAPPVPRADSLSDYAVRMSESTQPF